MKGLITFDYWSQAFNKIQSHSKKIKYTHSCLKTVPEPGMSMAKTGTSLIKKTLLQNKTKKNNLKMIERITINIFIKLMINFIKSSMLKVNASLTLT